MPRPDFQNLGTNLPPQRCLSWNFCYQQAEDLAAEVQTFTSGFLASLNWSRRAD